ncbi:hypothetical protein AB0M29_44910 [Streptomyces sp. NPDC051976]|uniref:hypothetical protein n=1 Tax=Streptomyces sp. NPDC051976 TaxID=3154947 RepID=UPI00343C730F
MVNGISDAVIKQGIARDAVFVGRFLRDLSEPSKAPMYGILPFCIIPYFSLFIHEAKLKPNHIDPAALAALSPEAEEIIARSRHSLKLFEDTHRWIAGQIDYFNDKILPVHSSYFLGNTWLPFARFLETDLGIFGYDGRIISTTHSAAFHSGVESSKLFAAPGPYLQGIFEAHGRFFGPLGANMDSGPETFVAHLDSGRMDGGRDKRAARYYARVFNGKDTPAINGLVVGFQGMVNFADTIVSAGADVRNLEYTAFKMRYLALYAVLASLRQLHDDTNYPLSSRSTGFVRGIIDSPAAQAVTDRSAKPFRNTLMHYNLHPRFDVSKVDLREPLFGLVPEYFPAHDAQSFGTLVNTCIRDTANALNEWAGE